MRRAGLAVLFLTLAVASSLAASDKRAAPPGSFATAPPEYTRFTAAELTRGFLALAFGSDLRIGSRPSGIRRFDHPVRVRVIAGGSVPRADTYKRALAEFAQKIPNLRVLPADDAGPADVDVRLIDERDFVSAMEAAFGRETARAFVKKTDPQCMTSVKSAPDGRIVHVDSFIIVDQGDDVFLDCAYHETLHMFGLSNHDQRNPWTTLNQNRMVGYLSVYDRALLMLLYDPRMRPGMSQREVRRLLPQLIRDLHLAD